MNIKKQIWQKVLFRAYKVTFLKALVYILRKLRFLIYRKSNKMAFGARLIVFGALVLTYWIVETQAMDGCKYKSTAIPYREITGFLQGFPCEVIPPLHALAVYRV